MINRSILLGAAFSLCASIAAADEIVERNATTGELEQAGCSMDDSRLSRLLEPLSYPMSLVNCQERNVRELSCGQMQSYLDGVIPVFRQLETRHSDVVEEHIGDMQETHERYCNALS
ncbi:MAG: hypothetical protein AB8B83_06085 [Bdellovibrionales bacterium]